MFTNQTKEKISSYQATILVLVIVCGVLFYLMTQKSSELVELKKLYSICQEDVIEDDFEEIY